LEKLKLEAQCYKRSAFSLATQKTYKSQLRSFLQFCLEFECVPVPVSQETLICYVAYLARRLLPTSIPNYLNVIRLLHLESGYKNPLSDNFELNLLKRGISRQKGVAPRQKQPMSIQILLKIHALLNFDDPADLAFWSVCCIGFFGFLRKSTLLPATAGLPVERILTRGDIHDLDLCSFVLHVHHSKVIQFGQKVHTIPFVSCKVVEVCPVRALLSHFGASPLGAKGPLFSYMCRGREVTLTQAMFVVRLRKFLSSVGLHAKDFSAHSFRRGGASFAFSLGLSPLQIKLRGDWSSDAYERYVYISASASLNIAHVLSEGVVV
jgi:hypothetical protein